MMKTLKVAVLKSGNEDPVYFIEIEKLQSMLPLLEEYSLSVRANVNESAKEEEMSLLAGLFAMPVTEVVAPNTKSVFNDGSKERLIESVLSEANEEMRLAFSMFNLN